VCDNPGTRYGPTKYRNAKIVPDKESYLKYEQVVVECDYGYVMNPNLRVNWSPEGSDHSDLRVKNTLTCLQKNAWSRGEWFGLSTYALCVPEPCK